MKRFILFPILQIGIFILFLGKTLYADADNIGLGPLEIRDQFPIAMPHLSMASDGTGTLREGEVFFSYQLAIANTFLNSDASTELSTIEGTPKLGEGRITKEEASRGITEGDFFDSKTGRPLSGFRNYIDVESYRHTLKLEYGLFDFLEIGLEQGYISFVGGSFDSSVEGFHELFGISNDTTEGGYRSRSELNQYDFYVMKDGELVIAETKQFENLATEPVFHLKWNIWEGNKALPAVTVKLAYKPGDVKRSKQQRFTSSGRTDFGSWILFSKGFDPWYVYGGIGNTQLSTAKSHVFSDSLQHRFFALEYQIDSSQALIIQATTQSSMYPVSGPILGSQEQTSSFFLSRSTEFIITGYKAWFGNLFIELGFVEDYNQTSNQTDIAFFSELGYLY